MDYLIPFFILFIVSVVLAVRSMREEGIPREITKLLHMRKFTGRIVFFKGHHTKHYSSSSSSKSSV